MTLNGPSRMATTKALLIVAMLALIGAACGSSESEVSLANNTVASAIFDGSCEELSGEEVTIYSGRTENLIAPVLEAFECETGIEVAVRWGGNAELALLMSEEGDRTPADVFLSSSPGPIGFLESQGLLGALDDDLLGKVETQNHSADGTWVGFSGRKRVAVYNLDAVSDSELPASVLDLTDEVWRDRVALPATNGSFADWFTVFRDQLGDDVATQWLNDMVANGAKC